MSRRRAQRLPADPVVAAVESLAHDGRGVTHVEGKAVFVEGALPGERVSFHYRARHKTFDEGAVAEVIEASPDRVAPRCPHFTVCGGCSLQHLAPAAQIHAKQRVLVENLERIGKVAPAQWLEPLTGPCWGYRRKARLGVKYVIKKGRVLVGFREKHAPYLAELTRCEVLHPAVGERIEALKELVASLDAYQHIAQIEVAVGDEATALVFRNLAPLEAADMERLRGFGAAHDIVVYIQPAGRDSVTPVQHAAQLSYRLPAHAVELFFTPTDFTQVNAGINRAMVDRALELLAPAAEERVLDLFCGLGNFTLPLARRAREVVGVEGDVELVRRAGDNARRNGIDNARFYSADLEAIEAGRVAGVPWLQERFDKVLIDPPRTGALGILPHLARLGPRRLVYVSCNPATLARDAGELVNAFGYRLLSAGVMDMFPHTAHVESIALFER